MNLLRVMTLNIGNPSLQRARKQISWIESREEDVFVLTETKLSEGCLYFEEYFGEVGLTLFDYGNPPKFHVFFPKSNTGDLGVMVLSRFPILQTKTCFDENDPFFQDYLILLSIFMEKKLGLWGYMSHLEMLLQRKLKEKSNSPFSIYHT